MRIVFPVKYVLVLLLLGIGAYFFFPYLFFKIALWQRDINQLMSDYLHQIQTDKTHAGMWLIAISFLYGVFHAIGPGHGKFIIATYLSTHQTQLKTSMKLTFLSSLVQGGVAVCLTSFVVVILNLSSAYFKLSQLWLERVAFLLLLCLGITWCYQSGRKLYLDYVKTRQNSPLKIYTLQFDHSPIKIGQPRVEQTHTHPLACGCGHQHAPNPSQLTQARDWKSQLLVIFSIGMRPCSGAIFILFLAYMLDLYFWGIIATFAMAVGTGMTLSGFALIVLYARNTAMKVGKWYQFSPTVQQRWGRLLKLVAGILLIFFATSLLYSTTIAVRGGAALFG
ncbi:TPA: zinc transporter permease subunit ZevB [Pasteurella multocida]|nr:zinc transporter permease subunit ZevB [Pasteurella multocida]